MPWCQQRDHQETWESFREPDREPDESSDESSDGEKKQDKQTGRELDEESLLILKKPSTIFTSTVQNCDMAVTILESKEAVIFCLCSSGGICRS